MEKLVFRPGTHADISKIVELLKLSLGESMMPKSEAYWRWKHIDNPFGESPVLLAFDENKLVGVRAFMRWEWKRGDEILKAVRAVDTATHPNYQGKGIFKTLTLNLLKICEDNNVDLVFNSPNVKSKPGYIKMGWKEGGRLPIRMSIKNPFSLIHRIVQNKAGMPFLQSDQFKLNLDQNIVPLANRNWITNYSTNYLKWRYKLIPVIHYYSLNSTHSKVIFRFKETRYGVELRICDVFGEANEVKDLLRKLYANATFDYISISSCTSHFVPGWFKMKLKIGPQITLRGLNRSVDDFLDFSKWSPSLGDIEVF